MEDLDVLGSSEGEEEFEREDDVFYSDENQKMKRCQKIKDMGEQVPECFRKNTSKEEVVLEYVLQYQKEYAKVYNADRNLLLTPKNECGVLKFISTTLRPTKLPYKQLYTWDGCAQFIAEFLEYEELDPPDTLPEIIPAPSNVLKWQAGDSFDYSILLCSLLVGCGYDAFVVYGKAPSYITTRDEALMDCPDINIPILPLAEEEEIKPKLVETRKKEEVDKFSIPKEKAVVSEFDAMEEAARKRDEEFNYIRENIIDDDEPDYEKYDSLENSRIHAWCMIKKGKRQMSTSFFIEPNTGRRYELRASPYIAVEAIFNHRNFWINQKPNLKVEEINFDDFDTKDNNTDEWEYAMYAPFEKSSEITGEDVLAGGGIEEFSRPRVEEEQDEDEYLDMPPSWSQKLYLDRKAFDNLCPLGEKTVFYKKCKLDVYAAHGQPDGMVTRKTSYHDYKRHIIEEIKCIYAHRADKLVIRTRYPYEFKTVEEYAPGKKLSTGKGMSHLHKLIQIDGHLRQLYYYPHRNPDGLIYREERIGKKTIERYNGREDKMVHRSISFRPTEKEDIQARYRDNHCENVEIMKIVERYALHVNAPNETQIAKVEFNMIENKIHILYHYQERKITNESETFNRDTHFGMGDKLEESQEKSEEDKGARGQRKKKAILMEKNTLTDINKREQNAAHELPGRKAEDKKSQTTGEGADSHPQLTTVLEKTIYDKAKQKLDSGAAKTKEVEGEATDQDYLALVLEKLGHQKDKDYEFTHEQAILIRNEAFRLLRERLLARADIIQNRLDNETDKIEKRYQQLISKGERVQPSDEQEADMFFNTANFRMDILTERASQHYKNSLKKFEELDKLLNEDKRLRQLNKKAAE